jgi:threonine/homoserine/homoserine lactone efflux protein
MSLTAYPGFAAGVALLLAMPGPTNALLMAAGAERGLRRGLPLITVEIIAYGLAITPLLIFSEMLGAWREIGGLALKTIAIGIVLLLAFRLWQRAGKAMEGAVISAKSIFWVTLFNPKSLVFAFVIFPPVTGMTDIGAKAGLFTLLALAAGSLWIAAGALLASGRMQRAELIGRLSAIALCAFAVYLGMSAVSDAAATLG